MGYVIGYRVKVYLSFGEILFLCNGCQMNYGVKLNNSLNFLYFDYCLKFEFFLLVGLLESCYFNLKKMSYCVFIFQELFQILNFVIFQMKYMLDIVFDIFCLYVF